MRSELEKKWAGVCELHWDRDYAGNTNFVLYAREPHGQLVLLGTFNQGPFDTSLEVAQWAWRVLAREVPPAST